MSLRYRNPNRFKKNRKSPYDESGPNADSLRRSLEWLEKHGADTPPPHLAEKLRRDSVELRKPSEEVPKEEKPKQVAADEPPAADSTEKPADTTERVAEPTEQVAKPTEQAEPPTKTEPATIEAAQPQTETPRPEPETPEREVAAETLNPTPESQAPTPPKTKTVEIELELTPEEARLEAEAIAAALRRAESANRDDLLDARRFPKHYPAENADPERHERLCSICHHKDRDAIEQAFLDWRRPADIRYEFKLPTKLCIYRHAHAFGLFEKRAKALRFVLEKIMEESTSCYNSADSMIRAVRAYACLDERGRWVEPPRRLIISREPHPPRDTHASPLSAGREISVEPTKPEEAN